MPRTVPFFILDVFGQERYSGNQLAVFESGPELDPNLMQRVAAEIHFSESTFILSSREEEDAYPVRIFTPASELDFAGHPTLGTAWVIGRMLRSDRPGQVTLSFPAGRVPVDFLEDPSGGEILWMEQVPPVFGRTVNRKAMALALGLSVEDTIPDLPIEEVSTGLPFFVVPLATRDAVARASVNHARFGEIIRNTEAKAVLVFSTQGREPGHDLSVRVFVDYYGIPEDPATGSGNGCLAAYLCRHRVLGPGPVSVVAGQGHEMGRPSVLHLQAREADGKIRVRVGGKVIFVAQGQWAISG